MDLQSNHLLEDDMEILLLDDENVENQYIENHKQSFSNGHVSGYLPPEKLIGVEPFYEDHVDTSEDSPLLINIGVSI